MQMNVKAVLFFLLFFSTASLHSKETEPAKIPGLNLGQKPKVLFFTGSRFARGRFPESPLPFSDFLAAHNVPENGAGDMDQGDAGFGEALRPHEAATGRSGGDDGPRRRMALATYATDPEQARAVRALARSVRERSGDYADSPIYVVTTDPGLFPAVMGKHPALEILPLEIERGFLDYPLALKAFAAALVEKRVRSSVSTLAWLDPGVIVLGPLQDLDLGDKHDAAVRPVTLANTIALPPQTAPNGYWEPIYKATGLAYAALPSYETIVDPMPIQPYFNCEVFSFNPKLGIAAEWARLLARFLQDGEYQKNACTTFLRKLFLHQAVLSAVITARSKPERVKALPLSSSYPFNQHDQLPAAKKAPSLNDLSLVIFDYAWDKIPNWMEQVRIEEPLKNWLLDTYLHYLEIAPQIYRVEGSCNSYLVVTKNGSVLIDPAGAAVAPEFFKKIIEKNPLKAILLTHAHPDHSDDIGKWRAGLEIPVIAQREFKRYFEYAGELQGFFARRNAIWSGKSPKDLVRAPKPPQEKPGIFFADEYEMKIGGMHFKMLHTPGETPDHATIRVPELKAVFVGDNYYEYFINNSTFRGTMIRPVLGYIRALETALAFDPEYFFMGHGAPIIAKGNVKKTAVNFRDALKYVYGETIKGINAGKDLYTLMHEIRLPEKYDIPQYFGKVEWTVRGIWQEYVGWFDENPVSMYAEPLSDLYPDLAGLAGEEKLLARAREYLEKKEHVKVLHLTEIVLRADPRHKSANEVRLDALNSLKAGTRNFIERIWLNHAIRLCEENLALPAVKEAK
jgi:glyoxylase-like metal-dependent hydrolase (beta-lactamase superfamily II)